MTARKKCPKCLMVPLACVCAKRFPKMNVLLSRTEMACWDHRDSDGTEVVAMLKRLGLHAHMVETGDDSFAMVVSTGKMTKREAQKQWDDQTYPDEEDA